MEYWDFGRWGFGHIWGEILWELNVQDLAGTEEKEPREDVQDSI